MSWRPRSRRHLSLIKPEVIIAQGAAKEANRRLAETQDQWPKVKAIADTLAEMRQRNHFAERIRAAIKGGE